jgi:hypothetical protein
MNLVKEGRGEHSFELVHPGNEEGLYSRIFPMIHASLKKKHLDWGRKEKEREKSEIMKRKNNNRP